jgi:hypothetical protein
MSDPQQLTPKEQYQASLYKDPARLYRTALIRKLTLIIPSVVLMVVWYVTRDPQYAIVGYGILLYQSIRGIILSKRGTQSINRIMTNYEAKGQRPQ